MHQIVGKHFGGSAFETGGAVVRPICWVLFVNCDFNKDVTKAVHFAQNGATCSPNMSLGCTHPESNHQPTTTKTKHQLFAVCFVMISW